MTIAQQDIDALVADLDRAQQAWISGQPSRAFAQDDDMTLFGPFGGEGVRGGGGLSPIQTAVASFFRGGSGETKVVKAIVEGDLLVLVLLEKSDVMFQGRDEPHPWALRITEVFKRKPDGAWVRLHRHADPLVRMRPLEPTLALLAQ
jgi:ketosteroid isomerase-like protein